MTMAGLLIFMAISQIVVAGYLLYSFNDVERESRKRTADLRAHFDAGLLELERRLNGSASTPPRKVTAVGSN